MLLTVSSNTQDIIQQPGVLSPVESITVPRSTQIPIVVQFTDATGTIIDPEVRSEEITSSSVAAATLITCPAPHGLTSGDSVTIADHAGITKAITSVAISSMTVTITIASPGVITIPVASALAVGDTVSFTTTGALPTGITASVVYFVKEVVSSTSFKISEVSGGAAIVTTGTQSGIHKALFDIAVITSTAHGLVSGDSVEISEINGAAPGVDGFYTINVIDANKFTVPVSVTTGGAGGFVAKATSTPDINGVRTVTVISPTTFTIPVNVTTAGEGGSFTKSTDLLLRWTVKAEGQFDGAIIASIAPNAFAKSGSGTSTKFTGSCNYITNELNSLLGIDATTSGSISTIASSTFTSSTAHLLIAGDSIVFTAGTIPVGLVAGQTYYILTAPSSTTFTISATVGGTVITPSSSGASVTFVGYLTSDDVEEAVCMAELSWTGAYPSKTNWITHNIRNDLYKADEASPVTTGGYDGKSDIGSGVDFLSVTFPTPLASANWHFLGTPMITNTTLGSSALGLDVVALTARTTAGFTVYFSGQTNASTYDLEWQVRLD